MTIIPGYLKILIPVPSVLKFHLNSFLTMALDRCEKIGLQNTFHDTQYNKSDKTGT